MRTDNQTELIKHALEAMCNHPLFSKSTVYTRMLRYLVKKAQEGEDIKEYTIGVDLFGGSYTTDKNDGTVRIYMYKLRKRLVEYYQQVSEVQPIYFKIEKGQYNLEFVLKEEFTKNEKGNDTIEIRSKDLRLVILVLLAVTCTFLIVSLLSEKTLPFWNHFLSSDQPTTLVVSDNYVLMAKNEYGERHATLYGKINSDEDFLTYIKKNPERQLETTDYTLCTRMSVYCTEQLTRLFVNHKAEFDIQFENDITLDHIKKSNLIFIGPKKSMSLSKSVFLQNSKVFTPINEGYIYNNGEKSIRYVTKHRPEGKIEYAMVSYGSVSPGVVEFYFVSNHDIGVLATLRNFMNKEWLKEFISELPSEQSYFNALFKVEGLQRTDMSCELVELEIVK